MEQGMNNKDKTAEQTQCKCLEDLEGMECLNMKQEILRRMYKFLTDANVSTIEMDNAQHAFIQIGYSYFESCYLIAGTGIQYCSLLSRKTLLKIKELLVNAEETTSKKSKLETIIYELDEHILTYLLRQDTIKFNRMIETLENQLVEKFGRTA